MDNGHPNIYSSRYEDAKNPFVGFCKMILVWHGSIFKLIWTHLVVFVLAFSGISLVYRNILIHDEEQRKTLKRSSSSRSAAATGEQQQQESNSSSSRRTAATGEQQQQESNSRRTAAAAAGEQQ